MLQIKVKSTWLGRDNITVVFQCTNSVVILFQLCALVHTHTLIYTRKRTHALRATQILTHTHTHTLTTYHIPTTKHTLTHSTHNHNATQTLTPTHTSEHTHTLTFNHAPQHTHTHPSLYRLSLFLLFIAALYSLSLLPLSVASLNCLSQLPSLLPLYIYIYPQAIYYHTQLYIYSSPGYPGPRTWLPASSNTNLRKSQTLTRLYKKPNNAQ